jgi:hypothetical protein
VPSTLIIHSHAPCSGVRSLRRDYPSQADAGLAFTLALERVCVKGFEVKMDDAAHADMERAEEAARAHAAAVRSAGGTATMAGPYAARIQSAGGTATMAGEHAARIHSLGGKATMSGEHAARIHSLGGTAGGKATMSGEHAARIHSLGGKATRGKIYKKPKQTAAQQARAEYMRKHRAAKRAAESIGSP